MAEFLGTVIDGHIKICYLGTFFVGLFGNEYFLLSIFPFISLKKLNSNIGRGLCISSNGYLKCRLLR